MKPAGWLCLIGLAFGVGILVGVLQSGARQESSRYEIATTENGHAYRLDRVTGEMRVVGASGRWRQVDLSPAGRLP